jgi:hypothetical protein
MVGWWMEEELVSWGKTRGIYDFSAFLQFSPQKFRNAGILRWEESNVFCTPCMHQSRDHLATTFVCTRFTVNGLWSDPWCTQDHVHTRARLTAVLAIVLIHPRSTVCPRDMRRSARTGTQRKPTRRVSAGCCHFFPRYVCMLVFVCVSCYTD